MNPLRFPFALLAFLAVAAVTPVWMYYVYEYGAQLSMEAQFIAGLSLPAMSLFLLSGWIGGDGE